jgi:hypothetical protein
VQNLIDTTPFKYTYTSGVLSFAPGEEITPEMEEAIMDEFEQAAFGRIGAGPVQHFMGTPCACGAP